jgi:hypothetical protein
MIILLHFLMMQKLPMDEELTILLFFQKSMEISPLDILQK